MELNLQILQADLDDIVTDAVIINDILERSLIYPVLYSGETQLSKECLYISKGADLPTDPYVDFRNSPSFICIGTPPAEYLKGKCGIITVKEYVSVPELLKRVSALFHMYNKWDMDVRTAIASNQPLITIGRLTEPIFNNPVGLYTHNFKCYFLVADSKKYKHPYEQDELDGGIILPGEDIDIMKHDEEYINSSKYKRPTIFPADLYGYRSLYQNIFSDNGDMILRILVDEISHEFTARDFSLIAVSAEHIKLALKSISLLDFGINSNVTAVLDKMLSHIYLEEDQINTVLEQSHWDCFDNYFCFVVYPSEADYATNILSYLGSLLSACCTQAKYLVFKKKIVFIANLTEIGKSRDEVFNLFVSTLRDNMLKASISTVFSDFKNLYYYYRQCNIAMRIGKVKFPTYWYYKFEDNMLNYVAEQSLQKFIPQALFPEGLLRLIEHDKQKGTDYTTVLKVYLQNNMSPTATLKKLYMHRNTFAYRLEKLLEVLDMDLEDPDIRLSLLLSFKMLELYSNQD